MNVGVATNRPAVAVVMRLGMVDVQGAGATHRTGQGRRTDRLIDDLADGTGAATALGAAAETAVDMTGRPAAGAPNSVAHLVVGQHIAGANDHLTAELNARL